MDNVLKSILAQDNAPTIIEFLREKARKKNPKFPKDVTPEGPTDPYDDPTAKENWTIRR